MNPSSPQYSTYAQSQSQSMNPAFLNQLQSSPGPNFNMPQKMGGPGANNMGMNGMSPGMNMGGMGPMGGMNMNSMNNMGMAGMNTSHLMHQQQQPGQMGGQQRPMMNGSMGGGMNSMMAAGNGGHNPAGIMGNNMMGMGGSNAMMGTGGGAGGMMNSNFNSPNPSNSMMGGGNNMGMDMSASMPNTMSGGHSSPTHMGDPRSNTGMHTPNLGNMSHHPSSGQNHNSNMSMNAMGMMGNMPSNMNMGNMNNPNSFQNNQAMMSMMGNMGMSREQLNNMSPMERSMMNQKIMMANQQQFHPNREMQQQMNAPFERPSSSSSSHNPMMNSNGHSMMPPPSGARPPTAQSMMPHTPMGTPSRPGTAMDVARPGTASGMSSSPPPSMPGGPSTPQRPPSRAVMDGMMGGMNGFPPSTPQMSPTHAMPSGSPPPPGSPSLYGMQRPGTAQGRRSFHEGESPRIGTMGLNMGGMPNGMPSGGSMNGVSSPIQREPPRPMSAMSSGGIAGMPNMNMGIGAPSGMGLMAGNVRARSTSVTAQPQPPSAQPKSAGVGGMPFGGQPDMMMGPPGNISSGPEMPHVSASPTVSATNANAGNETPTTSGRMPSVAPTSHPSGPSAPPKSHPSLPPLPAGVNLDPAVTQVSIVPLLNSEKTIPELDEKEIRDVQEWMKTDKAYQEKYRAMKDRMKDEVRNDVFGPSTIRWWEKGSLSANANMVGGRWRGRTERFDVRYPGTGYRERKQKGRKGARREGLRLPQKLDQADANRPEQLVPIRLEFDVDQHRMKDTFVWNLNDPVVTPENFAQTIVEDYKLAAHYHQIIVRSIRDQLSDFKEHCLNFDGETGEYVSTDNTLQAGSLDDKDATWWESWRKRLRSEYLADRKAGRKKRKVTVEDEERPMSVDEFHVGETPEDMRILIRLDITVGSVKLDDQFEWDITNQTASPEGFAHVYAKELGLAGEFTTAIAHQIREQVQAYQKSLFLVGHPSDGSALQDEELRLSFLPSISSGARPLDQVSSFTPLLNYVSDGEIDRNEKEREKEMNRRRKRNTRGKRGVLLPDREPIRTYRTPAIGFPELDPAAQALAAAANAPVSRRAAAAAASLTIANMVASENGQPILTQTTPSAPQQSTPVPPKPRKIKGLFKAPPVPPSVLSTRAAIEAPTPSTASDFVKRPSHVENEGSSGFPSLPAMDRTPRAMTARKVKELEREAREREYADGQHPNMINGVWHCSNCGCPESIAIGRRKGPLGDKSQCGTCGKFWHRHRRPRPVEYNTSEDFHRNVKKDADIAKTVAKKKGGAAALRAAQAAATLPSTPASEPQTPRLKTDGLPAVAPPDDRLSPVSTASSHSEPPLSQRKANGNAQQPVSVPPSSTTQKSPAIATEEAAMMVVSPPGSPSKARPPEWLSVLMAEMQGRYPNDQFDVTLRKVNAAAPAEWRVKCTDCPGKLYKPGPEETLTNFEVHLKNRAHRARVEERLNADGGDNGS